MSILTITRMIAQVNVTFETGLPYIEAINDIWEKQDLSNHFWVYYIDGKGIDIVTMISKINEEINPKIPNS